MKFIDLITMDEEKFNNYIYDNVLKWSKEQPIRTETVKMIDLSFPDILSDLANQDETDKVFIPNSKGKFRYMTSEMQSVNIDIPTIIANQKKSIQEEMAELKAHVEDIDGIEDPSKDYYYENLLDKYDDIINDRDFKVSMTKIVEHDFGTELINIKEFNDFIKKHKLKNRYVHFIDKNIFLLTKSRGDIFNKNVVEFLKENFNKEESMILIKRWFSSHESSTKYTYRAPYFG